MVYDGVEQATSATRLEAFIHQAREYQQRHAKVSKDSNNPHEQAELLQPV
jgi:hypothetical protein